eukprot:CAMPEP_0206251896 /NCGR_PEP_ID=MMETSP0047_2-20121206/22274_1 /ASSEMBLY_ACC=CAM_ASM_000192 /TAXON_ID=195065 /ORGANISM="Chroomonas mesostigmatica_cf, Strain CCMP1168" /LENGTH=110 /DNA_ID=CAMNT_0053677891 /DNA_START=42 /DNA_END=374 /DNA_ORIENTATION=-
MAIGNAFHKTSVRAHTLDPQWNEAFDFGVRAEAMQGMLLTLTVEDESAALRDEPIGQLSIPLNQLAVRGQWEGWFDLRTMKGDPQGTAQGAAAVHLRLMYDDGAHTPTVV